MHNNVYAVLLAGGKGTRLWPLSTGKYSKSFVRIGKEKSLIEETIARLKGLIPKGNIIIVVDKAQEELLKRFVRGLPKRSILVEPFGRSTASAVGLAAISLKPDDIMVVLPTDATIKGVGDYRKTLSGAVNFVAAKEGVLVCVGIAPKEAQTAFGYIKVKSRLKGRIYSIERFIEKPSEKKALALLKKRSYLWNAGMFVFRAKDILRSAGAHAPLLHRGLMLIKKDKRKIKEAYRRMKNISIDYQIMEKAKNLCCAKGNFSWRDLGNWRSISGLFRKDRRGNRLFGKAALVDTRDCVIYNATKDKLGIVGLKDTIVVCAKKGTLVCSKKDAEKVRELANKL